MPASQLNLRVWRGGQDGGDFVDYTVDGQEGEVVLDVVHRLQATQANDLAVRWNCKAGKCGSCSAEINGKPRLMCMTRLSTLDLSEPITLNPIRTFPVVKDLVTDVSFNYEMAKRVPPFTPATDNAGGKFRMQQRDVDRIQEFRKCIECFLCQNVCHVIRDHEENKPVFAGPRFFIAYAGLDMHPLDTLDRRSTLQDDFGLGMCNITKCCTEVCPENIHITDNGIIPMKERVVDRRYDPVVFLGNKIGLRSRTPRQPVGPYRAPTAPDEYVKAALGLAPPPNGTDPAPTFTPPVDEVGAGAGGGVLTAAPPKVASSKVGAPQVAPPQVAPPQVAPPPRAGAPGAAAPGAAVQAPASAPLSARAKTAAPAAAAASGVAALLGVVLWRRRGR